MFKFAFFFFLLILSFFSFAQSTQIECDTLFTFHFGNADTIFNKYLIKQTITEKAETDKEQTLLTAFELDKISETELLIIDTMFIDNFKVLSFGISSDCCGLDVWYSKISSYFDLSKLQILRSHCSCKQIWFENLVLQNLETQRTIVIPVFRMF